MEYIAKLIPALINKLGRVGAGGVLIVNRLYTLYNNAHYMRMIDYWKHESRHIESVTSSKKCLGSRQVMSFPHRYSVKQ